jgi:2-polyprenyl-3-methyl-5-hydroxy-6-metoxy-1,4-benzoquinol methylase
MTSNYNLKPFKFSSHDIILKLIKPNSEVLDLGCSKGYLASQIKEKGCTVTGIDNNREDLLSAKKECTKTLLMDISKEKIKGKYDIIILGDIIEHLADPLSLLKSLKTNLKAKGYLLISVPNGVNIYARIKILFGNFNYEEKGIFDKTHLRFFTLKSFKKLIIDSGYSLTEIKYSPIPVYLISSIPKILLTPIYYLFIMLTKLRPQLFAYQFIAKIQ